MHLPRKYKFWFLATNGLSVAGFWCTDGATYLWFVVATIIIEKLSFVLANYFVWFIAKDTLERKREIFRSRQRVVAVPVGKVVLVDQKQGVLAAATSRITTRNWCRGAASYWRRILFWPPLGNTWSNAIVLRLIASQYSSSNGHNRPASPP